jgi:hypothetical protein
MTLFDLLFIVLFLTSVVTLATAAVVAILGRFAKALRILRNWAICFAIYMAIVFTVGLATPQRILQMGEDRCNDDWCLAVKHVEHQGSNYTLTLQISSRAKRVSQREKGVNVLLVDSQGRRFSPAPDPAAVPFDVLLQPGEAVETKRWYTLPGDSRDVGVVVAHEGSYCFPGCFIIGDEANPLHKRTIVPVP